MQHRMVSIPTQLWTADWAIHSFSQGQHLAILLYFRLNSDLDSNLLGLRPLDIQALALEMGQEVGHVQDAITWLAALGLLTVDIEHHFVWIHEAAIYQFGLSEFRPEISPKDRRAQGVLNIWNACPSNALKRLVRSRLGRALHIPGEVESEAGLRDLYARQLIGPVEEVRQCA